MDRWDAILIIIAAYVSIISLVRLMANRRNDLVAKIRDEIVRQRATAKSKLPETPEQQDQDAA